jgi:N-methylhydantoinase A
MKASVGDKLSLEASEASGAVAEMVEENMSSAARVHAIESGKEIKERVLIAFGGGAPLHVAGVMQKLGMRRFIVPKGAGVGSAVGFLRAPVSYEVVRSLHQKLSSIDPDEVNTLLAAMSKTATATVAQAAPASSELTEIRTASMRYVGQGHEITVSVPAREFSSKDGIELKGAFEARYREIYRRNVPGADVEVLTWSVVVTTPTPPIVSFDPITTIHNARPVGRREVFESKTGRHVVYAIYWRDELEPGAKIAGPTIVEEDETSTVIPTGMSAVVLPSEAILREMAQQNVRSVSAKETVDA